MAAVHRDKPGRSTRWPPDQPQTEARHVITPCHPRRLIMLDGAARPKGATRRCAAGPRPAPDPGSPIQKPAAAGGQARSKQATPPNRAAASGHWPGPVIRLTPAGSTDKQGSAWLRWVLNQAAQTAKRHPDFAATYQAIAARRGKQIATTAIARKLLARAWHLLTDAQITAPQAPTPAVPTDREGVATPRASSQNRMSRPCRAR